MAKYTYDFKHKIEGERERKREKERESEKERKTENLTKQFTLHSAGAYLIIGGYYFHKNIHLRC